jgi:hypothetical protein
VSLVPNSNAPKGIVNLAPLLILKKVFFVSLSVYQPLLYQLKLSNVAEILFSPSPYVQD